MAGTVNPVSSSFSSSSRQLGRALGAGPTTGDDVVSRWAACGPGGAGVVAVQAGDKSESRTVEQGEEGVVGKFDPWE